MTFPLVLFQTSCDLLSGVPAGTVTGQVNYDGRPAPGITLKLQTQSSGSWTDKATGSTDASGQYTFSQLSNGLYRIVYAQVPVVTSGGVTIGPKTVRSWTSNSVSIGLGGARIAPFELAYDGLIYPESGKSNAYSASQPLPFHWSTHRDAISYRVNLYSINGGVTASKPTWQSDWTPQPVTQLSQGFAKGNYQWEVEIDADSEGSGFSERRGLDLDFQTPQASS